MAIREAAPNVSVISDAVSPCCDIRKRRELSPL